MGTASLSWEEEADEEEEVVRMVGDDMDKLADNCIGAITGAGFARSDFIGMNATLDLMSCAKPSGGTGGASFGGKGRGTGKLDRPPLILIVGRGGSGVVGEGMGGPPELRWVPVDLRRGTGLPASSASISAFPGVIGATEYAEYVSSLPV